MPESKPRRWPARLCARLAWAWLPRLPVPCRVAALCAVRSHWTGKGSADQTGQVGDYQDQGRGEYDQTCLPDFGLFEHGHLPFVFVGVASNTRSKGLSGYSVTPGRGLNNRPGKTRRRNLLLSLYFHVVMLTLGGMSQIA